MVLWERIHEYVALSRFEDFETQLMYEGFMKPIQPVGLFCLKGGFIISGM